MSVFNLVWAHPLPPKPRSLPAARNVNNTYVTHKQVPSVILFPCLMTPCVYRPSDDDPWIELLLATSEANLSAEQVNRQLKVYRGLDAEKRYHAESLFVGVHGKIVVQATKPDGQGILRTHERFAGVVHSLVCERLERKGLTHFYRVRVHRDALQNARDAGETLQSVTKLASACPTWPAELSDELIADVLKERHKLGEYKELPNHGWFAFNVGEDGPQVWDEPGKDGPTRTAQNEKEPIQSYHPVYVLGDGTPEHLNFGHLTDIHVNSRLDILQQNPATVLTYKQSGTAMAHGSSPVGALIQPTNRSFGKLLRAIGQDESAHVLLIGGDLIDHQLNAYATTKPPEDMRAVWDAVDVHRLNQKGRYAPGIDMVAFYSMLITFCRSSDKPVFGVNGNHDCYVKPFGISPRVGGTRANAGIPADVNLTFYEAALAFGPSWSDCEVPIGKVLRGKTGSSFEREWMEWFYAVFTPFTEFSVQLPKQQLVCLGWGNNEDMMAGGQEEPGGWGHLPRSDESVSDVQLSLLREATGRAAQRRVIVLSHFTIASFADRVPFFESHGHEPTRGEICGEDMENEFNLGTFERHRNELLDLLMKRSITCVLSGHSHRRALYFLGEMEQRQLGAMPVQRSLSVTIRDPEGFKIPASQPLPLLVVSDCSGPYPRHNRYGEFKGWGSDRPSGSIVLFDSAGRPEEVKVVKAPVNPPRLAVAVDYLDLEGLGKQRAIKIETEPFTVEGEREMWLSIGSTSAPFYVLNVHLHKSLVDARVYVRKIVLHAPSTTLVPLELPISKDDAVDGKLRIPLNVDQSKALFCWAQPAEPERFVAVFFEWSGNPAVSQQYNSDDPWIFEVKVEYVDDNESTGRYRIARPWRTVHGEASKRDEDWQDAPDFSWREGFREKTGDDLPPGGVYLPQR